MSVLTIISCFLIIVILIAWVRLKVKHTQDELNEMLYHYCEFKINTQERINHLEKKVEELSKNHGLEAKQAIEDLEQGQLIKYTRLAFIKLLKDQVGGGNGTD